MPASFYLGILHMEQYELFAETMSDSEAPVALEEVFAAYYECRRCKRRTVNALAFELNFEREVVRLWREINSGTYKIGRSISFIVKYPVQREIFAADFRDRIVHHLVISKINPLFEKEFIAASYSCRSGKGTLYGVRDVRAMINDCAAGTGGCYVLRLDIRSFFMSIDKRILCRMAVDFINAGYHAPDKRILLRLVKQIIMHNPENNCVIKGHLSDWNGLPYYKSLFWSDKNRGLPIGNLTSQIFANFYLNRLDKYITEELGIRHYGRYVDDFILLHRDKNVLLEARRKIELFLRSRLGLELHPHKVYLQYYDKGVRFIGAVIRPHRIYIHRRTKGALYRKINEQLPFLGQKLQNFFDGLEHFCSCVNSYLGLMRHYNTYNLRTRILSRLRESFLGEVMDIDPNSEKLAIDKRFRRVEQKKRRLRRQRDWRRRQHKKENQRRKHGSIHPTADLSGRISASDRNLSGNQ